MNNVRCRYCKGTQDIPGHTVIDVPIKGEVFGSCRPCMNAPACEGCHRHPVADKATISETIMGKLCEVCCAGLGLPVSKPAAPVAAPVKVRASTGKNKRKPALVGAA